MALTATQVALAAPVVAVAGTLLGGWVQGRRDERRAQREHQRERERRDHEDHVRREQLEHDDNVRREQWQREDRSRWSEHRLSLHASLLDAMTQAFDWSRTNKEKEPYANSQIASEGMVEVARLITEVRKTTSQVETVSSGKLAESARSLQTSVLTYMVLALAHRKGGEFTDLDWNVDTTNTDFAKVDSGVEKDRAEYLRLMKRELGFE